MQQEIYEISWHHLIKNDMMKIHAFIAQNISIGLANDTVKNIYTATNPLRSSPERFPRERQLLHRTKMYLYIRYKKYKILYYVEGQNVYIVHVYPERQNPLKIRRMNRS